MRPVCAVWDCGAENHSHGLCDRHVKEWRRGVRAFPKRAEDELRPDAIAAAEAKQALRTGRPAVPYRPPWLESGLAECWRLFRDELLAEAEVGHRPWAWWEIEGGEIMFDFPEPEPEDYPDTPEGWADLWDDRATFTNEIVVCLAREGHLREDEIRAIRDAAAEVATGEVTADLAGQQPHPKDDPRLRIRLARDVDQALGEADPRYAEARIPERQPWDGSEDE